VAQHRIPIGSHGDIKIVQQDDGRWLARTQVRDRDGRVRSVRVIDKTKGAAGRKLERRLDERIDPTAIGVTAATTFEELAQVWLRHRRDHGKARSTGELAMQTLAIYSSEIQNVIIPAIGGVRIGEASVPLLDRLFADVEHGRDHGAYRGREGGRSTKQLRVVLTGMLGLAVAHGALPANPMRDTASSARESRREVEFLTVPQANYLRWCVQRSTSRVAGERMANYDLEELVDVLLGTGCRLGEALAIRPRDLIDISGPLPTLHVCGTLIEPRKGFVDSLHRQDTTKTRDDRTLILPGRVVAVLQRMDRDPPADPDAPVFGTRVGTWLSPANLRTRMRRAISRATPTAAGSPDEIHGSSFHTLRRTVGTLVAHEVSLDAAREQLGHRDPSVTYQHYVGRRAVAPDVRHVLNRLLADLPPSDIGSRACLERSESVLGISLAGQTSRSRTALSEPASASRDSSRGISR
jgi:integrase